MSEGKIWAFTFTGFLVFYLLATYIAGRYEHPNAKQLVQNIPSPVLFLFVLIQAIPLRALSSTGKKWQIAAYVLLAITIFCGFKVGEFIPK